VRRFAIGLSCCVVGVVLYAVNWLGAAAASVQVQEWDTQKGKVSAAYAIVGHQPLIIGVIAFVAGLLLIVWSYWPIRAEDGKASQD
jgi:hypothetical protein